MKVGWRVRRALRSAHLRAPGDPLTYAIRGRVSVPLLVLACFAVLLAGCRSSEKQIVGSSAPPHTPAPSAGSPAHATATSSTLSASGTFTLIGADVIKVQGSASTGSPCTGEYYLGPVGNEYFLDVHAGAYVTFYDENHTVVGSGELQAGRLAKSTPPIQRACQFPLSAENIKPGALFYTVAIASHAFGTRFTADQLNTIQLNYRSINPVQQSESTHPTAPEGAALPGSKVAGEIAGVYGPQGVTGVKCPSTMPVVTGKVYECTADQNISFKVTIVSPKRYMWQAVAGLGSAGQTFPVHTGKIGR